MLEQWYLHLIIQLGIFSYTFCDFIDGNGWQSMINNSIIYKLLRFSLLLCLFLMMFQTFTWWVAILYMVGSYFVQQAFVGLVASQLVPLDFFEPKLSRGPLVGKEKVAANFIVVNYIIMVLILIFLIIQIF
jgi:hypothetical protein